MPNTAGNISNGPLLQNSEEKHPPYADVLCARNFNTNTPRELDWQENRPPLATVSMNSARSAVSSNSTFRSQTSVVPDQQSIHCRVVENPYRRRSHPRRFSGSDPYPTRRHEPPRYVRLSHRSQRSSYPPQHHQPSVREREIQDMRAELADIRREVRRSTYRLYRPTDHELYYDALRHYRKQDRGW